MASFSGPDVAFSWMHSSTPFRRKPDRFPARRRDDSLPSIVETCLTVSPYCRMLFGDGAPSDFIYLFSNPAFQRTGLGPRLRQSASVKSFPASGTPTRSYSRSAHVSLWAANRRYSETFVESLPSLVWWFRPILRNQSTSLPSLTSSRTKELGDRLRLLALVLDQIQEQVTVTDLAGNVTYVNRTEVEALASPKENRLSRHVSVYGDGPQADATQGRGLPGDPPLRRLERQGRQLPGGWLADAHRPAHQTGSRRVRQAGRHMVGVNTDIRNSRSSRRGLKASEALPSPRACSMPSFWSTCRAAYGTAIHPYEAMLGCSSDELESLTYVDLTPARWHGFEARIIAEQIIPHGHSAVRRNTSRRMAPCSGGTANLPPARQNSQPGKQCGRSCATSWNEGGIEARMQLAHESSKAASQGDFVGDLRATC